jgi:hypothetical protein
LREADWLTIDGVTGSVYAGMGDIVARNWRDFPEIVALSRIIEIGIVSGGMPNEIIGRMWRIRDFFAHAVPLTRVRSCKRPVSRRSYVSFSPVSTRRLHTARSRLTRIPTECRENYTEILLSLAETLSRILSSALGLGQHHLYFRPLWDPNTSVVRNRGEGGNQFVGFEYFQVNRYVPHLPDISKVTFLLEVEVEEPADEWFLDFTSRLGESLVPSPALLKGYNLLINDARVSHDDVPAFYDSIRRREYYWRFYRVNRTSHQEIIEFLATWPNHNRRRPRLIALCSQLGLLRDGKLTRSGESLLGKPWTSKL